MGVNVLTALSGGSDIGFEVSQRCAEKRRRYIGDLQADIQGDGEKISKLTASCLQRAAKFSKMAPFVLSPQSA